MFDRDTYLRRRKALKESVGSGLILMLGNDDSPINCEANVYRFRQDSSFLYFFGLSTAGLNAIIDIDNDREIIFGDELTIDDIVWMGPQPTLREQVAQVGVTDVRPLNEIKSYLEAAQKKGQRIKYLPIYRPEHSLKLLRWMGIPYGEQKPSVDLIRGVVNLRNYKEDQEIAEIERAVDVTADMHMEAMRILRPGMKEYDIVAAVEAVARAHNCGTSFGTIATTHGQTLHNPYYGHTVHSGEMLLLDAGAETEMGYAGDLSSTIPADKKFTPRQKLIYDIQVASHLASVEMLRPGVCFEDVYDKSAQVIFDGLKGLGIFKGNAEEAVRAGAHAIVYPCGLGHMMGMDDHDMESLGEKWVGYDGREKSTQFGRKSLRLGRILEPRFVLTIEPGVYFIPELIDMWQSQHKFEEFINYDELNKWRDFSGIRNEEDYLITETGARLLGKRIPLTTEEVEALR